MMIALDKKDGFVCDIDMQFMHEEVSSLSVQPLKPESLISVRLQSTGHKREEVSVCDHSLTLHEVFSLCGIVVEELKQGTVTFITASGRETVRLQKMYCYW